MHQSRRHHVVGQCLGKEGFQGLLVDVCRRRIVKTERLAVLHLGGDLLDAVKLVGTALNLTKLDAETAQLHLEVDTTQELQIAAVIVANKVARMIDLHRAATNSDLAEFLGRQLRTVPVALGHLRTGHTQLAHSALGDEVTVAVEH